ncbi:hypothetical protein SYNTR_1200 [Candidatus Syntrophocurvum alkaliphilum]|uniref:CRISPR type III-associated protein domain-containing protein n=1 Tax=Candidatus Syntrophocurvum alkaliphilum TaxID=2293317 RepID=A0A6I6DHP0_9FIRM|nr:RAMP superfamily CRISPR-associated protein [Candidatus Syntrophocurvum alkaliphilum]QGT99793.1 hypothetical protein SYNTR_1200 [Candidatus Syntrophocurvum alkaliphilum]
MPTRLKVELEARFDSAYSISSGTGLAGIMDSYVLRDARNIPFVPGTTIKGRMRYNTTIMARALDIEVCNNDVNGNEPCKNCIVCAYFGAAGNTYPGALYFDNLYPVLDNMSESYIASLMMPRRGVTIERQRGVAGNKLLFNQEVFSPSEAIAFAGSFEGSLRLNTVSIDQQINLLRLSIEHIRTLGGNQTRGLGWVNITPRFFVNEKEYEINDISEGGSA